MALRFSKTARRGKNAWAGDGPTSDRGIVIQAIASPARLAIAATRNASRQPQMTPPRPSKNDRAVPTVKELV